MFSLFRLIRSDVQESSITRHLRPGEATPMPPTKEPPLDAEDIGGGIDAFLRVDIQPGPPDFMDPGPVNQYVAPTLESLIIAAAYKLHEHIHVRLPNNYW